MKEKTKFLTIEELSNIFYTTPQKIEYWIENQRFKYIDKSEIETHFSITRKTMFINNLGIEIPLFNVISENKNNIFINKIDYFEILKKQLDMYEYKYKNNFDNYFANKKEEELSFIEKIDKKDWFFIKEKLYNKFSINFLKKK